MKRHRSLRVVYLVIVVLASLALAALFFERAYFNLAHENLRNVNFFFFWLAGRMVLTGQNPYDPAQWLAGQNALGSTLHPNQIFLYPLPMAYLMVPFGVLSLPAAYFVWQIVSELVIALSTLFLLRRGSDGRQARLFFPLAAAFMYFGPVYLSLQTGTMAPLALLILAVAIVLFEREHSFAGGVLLSLTILKPPQGLTLLILAVVWLLSRRDWKALAGLVLGGFILVSAGLIKDAQWIGKFVSVGRVALDRTLGLQSNLFSFAYLACGRSLGCAWIGGGAGALMVLLLAGLYIWRSRGWLSAWDAFNLIIPVGFLTTAYLWSYDQVLYVVPIVWIAGTLVKRTRSYLPTFGLMILLVVVSLVGLAVQAYTQTDLLSVFPTLVLVSLWLWLSPGRAAGDPGLNAAFRDRQ